MKIPLVIIGGGVIGLNIAYRLTKEFPDLEFIIIDKEKILGDETTGRNSGVLHAGLYYETGSLKHKLCLEGNGIWNELESELKLEINHCGKYIIASSMEEEEFEKLFTQASQFNLVPSLSHCDLDELDEIKKYTNCHRAFFSKTTAILNVPEAIQKFETDLYNKSIPILKANKIHILKDKKDEGFFIKTDREEFFAKTVINCAGLGAVELRNQLGLDDIENYFVKGNYLKLNTKFYNKSLLYPIPPKGLLGLGVHTSFGMDGLVRFGPDTEKVFDLSYKMNEDKIDQMFPSISSMFPSVSKKDLSLDYCGIRPKIKSNGKIYNDFWIKGEKDHKIKNYIELLGIESPGLTAAPAIAKYVLGLLDI